MAALWTYMYASYRRWELVRRLSLWFALKWDGILVLTLMHATLCHAVWPRRPIHRKHAHKQWASAPWMYIIPASIHKCDICRCWNKTINWRPADALNARSTCEHELRCSRQFYPDSKSCRLSTSRKNKCQHVRTQTKQQLIHIPLELPELMHKCASRWSKCFIASSIKHGTIAKTYQFEHEPLHNSSQGMASVRRTRNILSYSLR